jgi:glutaredoxin
MKSLRRSGFGFVFRRLVMGLFAIVFVLSATACSKKSKDGDSSKSDTLPPLTISDQTANLLLTWIDLRGGTHLEKKISDVPNEGRKLVRVLITGDDAGTGDPIYVTDLTAPSSDGKYTTRPMSRREWEDEIERRRGARVASLPDDDNGSRPAPLPRPVPRGDSHGDPGPGRTPDLPQVPDLDDSPPQKDPHQHLQIIVYGASWCGPCHKAMEHLDRKHIAYSFKDIDKDSDANREMSQKLQRNHLQGGSIPVIDVGGRLLIGYDPGALDRAIEQASGGTML